MCSESASMRSVGALQSAPQLARTSLGVDTPLPPHAASDTPSAANKRILFFKRVPQGDLPAKRNGAPRAAPPTENIFRLVYPRSIPAPAATDAADPRRFVQCRGDRHGIARVPAHSPAAAPLERHRKPPTSFP